MTPTSKVTLGSLAIVLLGVAVSIIGWGSMSWVTWVTAQGIKVETNGVKIDNINEKVNWIAKTMGKE